MMPALRFFSYVFHPVFSVVYAALIFCLFQHPDFIRNVAPVFIGRIALITVALPLLSFFVLQRMGTVSGLMIPKTYQRRLPLLIQMLMLYFLLVKLPRDGVWMGFYFFLIGALLSAYLAWALSFANLKISLHAMGMTGILGLIIGLSLFTGTTVLTLLGLWIALTGVVSASRISMRAHSIRELWMGALSGLLPQMALWYFWL